MSSETHVSPSNGTEHRRGELLPEHGPVRGALKLWVVLARAHAAIAARDQRNLDRLKLSRSEFGVLDALFFKGPLLLSELQRKILVSSGGVTYVVDRLGKRGLVERRPSPEDRRAIYAVLTEAGESFFREIFPDHAADLATSLSVLDGAEQEELGRLLKKLGTGAAALPDGPRREAPAAPGVFKAERPA